MDDFINTEQSGVRAWVDGQTRLNQIRHVALYSGLSSVNIIFPPVNVGMALLMDRPSSLANAAPQTNPPTRVVELLASQLTMIILALTIVALRLIGRFFVNKNPGWDDYAIIAATV